MSLLPLQSDLSMLERPAANSGTIAQLVSHRSLNGAVLSAGLVGAATATAGHRFLLVHRKDADFVDRPPFDRAERLVHDFDWFRPASLRSLLADLRQRQVRVMHSHSSDAHITGALLRAVGGPALIQTVHARNAHWHWWLADRVICPSDGARSFMLRLAVPGRRMPVIANFIDNIGLPSELARLQARRALSLADQAFIILCTGSLERRKNQGALVSALPALIAAGIDAHLLLVGRVIDDYGRTGSNEWEKQAPGRIHVLGERRDVDALLAACDVFALPSLREEAPLSIIEAMRAARPVISTLVGGIPDLVADGRTGMLLEQPESINLARALLSYAVDKQLRLDHGKAGRVRFEERFSTSGAIAALSETYGAALARRGLDRHNPG